MLFKMGKFYEMFEMDAHVGVEVLGLIYMKVRCSTRIPKKTWIVAAELNKLLCNKYLICQSICPRLATYSTDSSPAPSSQYRMMHG